jgi:hypothetical protein
MEIMAKGITNVSRALSVGQKFNIEISTLRRNYVTELLGFKYRDYLICQLPDLKKHGYLRDQLQIGTSVFIRTICESTTGEVVAFKSVVLSKISHPYPMVFYSYPKQIKVQPLRKELRLHTSIDSILTHKNAAGKVISIEGVITNRSENGCAFEYASDVKTIIEQQVVTIRHSNVKGSPKSRESSVHIRSERYFDHIMTVGLEYITNDYEVTEVLELKATKT